MQWSERVGRRIKLRDLHILLAVAQSGSLTKAAERLAVSKPVVSKVIADLEHTVGARLFDRDRHGAVPTIYGAALLKSGVAAFDDLKRGVEEIEFLRDPTAGKLRIGTSHPMMEGILGVIIDRLTRRHPGLFFEITLVTPGGLHSQALRERSVDVVFTRIPALDRDLDSEILFEDPQVVVAGTRSRWTHRRSIELHELITEPWILPKPDSPTGGLIAATFAASGLEVPQPEIVCGSFPLMNVLLSRGRLLALWPASVLRFSARKFAVKILPVKLPPLRRPVGVITLKGRTISPVAQLFIDCAREVAGPQAIGGSRRRER